jgi:hypothetical protein
VDLVTRDRAATRYKTTIVWLPSIATVALATVDHLEATARWRKEFRMFKKSMLALLCSATAWTAIAADPDSFGRALKFRDYVGLRSFQGTIPGGITCNSTSMNCVTITDARINFETLDAGTISLPPNSVNSLLCAVVNDTTSYTLRNATTSAANASINTTMTLTIESSVLNDPSLINPLTGAAFDGKIVFRQIGTVRSGTLAPNATSSSTESRSAGAACSPNFLSRQALRTSYGLSNTVAQRVLSGALTIRMGYKVTATNVSHLQYFPAIRLLGD